MILLLSGKRGRATIIVNITENRDLTKLNSYAVSSAGITGDSPPAKGVEKKCNKKVSEGLNFDQYRGLDKNQSLRHRF